MTSEKQESLNLFEGEWTSFKLSNDKYEFPNADMEFFFTPQYLHIKATVHDTHFKDGNRSWRYGDGFFINFITKTYPDNKPSNKFYGYGFSIIEGQQLTTLVNHNGVYSLAGAQDSDLSIKIDETKNIAYYDFKLQWGKLSPFHPLLHKTLGINVRYNSQNDDGSRISLQQTNDSHFDSETVFEKHYVPMHFHPSKKSEFQFAYELDTNLVLDKRVKAKIVAYSPKKQKTELKIILKDAQEKIIKEISKKVKLKKEINEFHEVIDLEHKTTSYTIDISLNDKTQSNYEFCTLNLKDIDEFKEKTLKFEKSSTSSLEFSSIYGLQFRIQQLEETISSFDSNQSATPILNLYTEIKRYLDDVEESGHYFNSSGYYLAGFKSKDDQTVQPYSLYLPKDFDIEQGYTTLVTLHGSGVNEVGHVRFMGKNFNDIGVPFIVAGPRGRGLSDYYIGQSEKDVFEMVEQMKSMFNINKTILFGFSMGGYGVWRLTFLYPESFDRAIIGSGSPYNDRTNDPAHDVRELRHNAKHIHYLVMHGSEDRAIPIGPTKEFMEVLEKEGFNVTFKVFEGAGHGNYDPGETLMKWLQKHL